MDTTSTIEAVPDKLQPGPQPGQQPNAVPGVSLLDPSAARTKAMVALAIMIIPLIASLEAVHLIFSGSVSKLDWILFAVMYVVHIGGISMGFHRYVTHRAFKTSPFFRALILIAGSMAGQGPIMFWVTTHRRHHTYSDQPGDPHSPNLHQGRTRWERLKGVWSAHMPWMLAPDMSSWSYFAKDILRDRNLFYYNQTYAIWVVLGLLLPGAIGGLLTMSWQGAWTGFIFGGMFRMFVANQFAWCVGSICHSYGSRPFNTGDHSTNNWFVALMTFGEGLQNNHHAFPSWYRHGVHWWELDISGWLLTLLGKLGVVWELRSPTPEMIEKVRNR
jgi:stearoyl-CoA desaturase (delta-9 desaturase)